jgi:hypothetical protein
MSLLRNRVTAHRPRVLVALAVAVPWVLAGCVDLTPPWEKVTAKGGAGGTSREGAGGLILDGPVEILQMVESPSEQAGSFPTRRRSIRWSV